MASNSQEMTRDITGHRDICGMANELAEKASGRKLDTWKEIASFFGRDERTVKRWEKERGLPVHRLPGGRRGTVYAFVEELTRWLRAPDNEEALDQARDQTIDQSVPDETESADSSISPPISETIAERPASKRRSSRVYGVAAAAGLLLVFGTGYFLKVHGVQERLIPTFHTLANGTTRKQAEDLYLQGRYHWNKRTPADLTIALDLFTKAAEVDSTYPLAYAGKADSYNLLREYTGMPASQAFPLAIASAKKAIALDDNLAEGHRALAFATFYWEWDVAAAEHEFQRAIELNPKDVEAHHWYATSLLAQSRYPEAIEQIEIARKLDPQSSSVATDRAIILYSSGRKEEGIALLEELQAAEPGFCSPARYLAGIYLERRQYDKYFAEAETAARITGDEHAVNMLQTLRKQYETVGEQAALRTELDDRLLALQRGRGDALSVAETYALLGRNQEAIDYLKKAYERHEYMLISIDNFRLFDDLRNEPEFQQLVKRIYSGGNTTT